MNSTQTSRVNVIFTDEKKVRNSINKIQVNSGLLCFQHGFDSLYQSNK